MILVIHIWISVWIINQEKYSAVMYYTSSIILMITPPQEWSTLAWAIQASSLWRDRDVQEKNFLSEIIILLPTPPRTTLIFFTASSVSDIFVIFQLEPVKYVNNNVSFCSLYMHFSSLTYSWRKGFKCLNRCSYGILANSFDCLITKLQCEHDSLPQSFFSTCPTFWSGSNFLLYTWRK